MNVQIQSIHFKADQKLKDYIQKKLSKLEHLYDAIIDSQVFLKVENNHQKINKTIEVKLNVQNQSIFKTQTSQSFEAATDLAVDALKIQLKKYKERLRLTA
ncbi:MAG: ribosome-associated translation inhibitor RaiA [Flavobacteriales bacterium]|nr:ribosome-associated translation inhibitor RaiA [Bacteroidota bacterium]MCB9240074.1 ribosome-associated translation inhibitor RaiA [Flavobacteriales bacterium]